MPFGRYELLHEIGRGGMASVWKARPRRPEPGLPRTLAIKRMLPELTEPMDRRQFRYEAELGSRLHHVGLPRVLEFGSVDGEPYIAMELLEGMTLRALAAQLAGRPPLAVVACVMRDVCQVLAYLHERHDQDDRPLALIHRDVSPDNIFVGVDGVARLLDLGLAKAAEAPDGPRTRRGQLCGKIAYMAPERLDGRCGVQADIWSAGVILHELLTGERLFRGADEARVMDLVRERPIGAASARNPLVSPALDQICERALARDLTQRYARASEMAAALDEVCRRAGWSAQATQTLTRQLATAPPLTLPPRRRRRRRPARTPAHVPRALLRALVLLALLVGETSLAPSAAAGDGQALAAAAHGRANAAGERPHAAGELPPPPSFPLAVATTPAAAAPSSAAIAPSSAAVAPPATPVRSRHRHRWARHRHHWARSADGARAIARKE